MLCNISKLNSLASDELRHAIRLIKPPGMTPDYGVNTNGAPGVFVKDVIERVLCIKIVK